MAKNKKIYNKTIGLTQTDYDFIVNAGKECGFEMVSGRNGQRGKFLVLAAKIARFTILSERGKDAGSDNPSTAVG